MDRDTIKKQAKMLTVLADYVARGDIEPNDELANLIVSANQKILELARRKQKTEKEEEER